MMLPQYETILRERARIEVPFSKIENDFLARKIAKHLIGDRADEVLIALALSTNYSLVGFAEIASMGSPNKVLVDQRAVIRFALLTNAVSIVVAHNHPSGNHEPSNDDKVMTNKLKEALKLVGVNLASSVIVTPNEYSSVI